MKIDRRCFLSLGVGGAVGTALTPLPLKITDDLSIWSQNWPWTPVPEDGTTTLENSICTLCPSGCGITVKKIDSRVIKIEGNNEHPINKGGICLLGLSGAQLLYGPSRIKSPLKKVGDRFQSISWKQAVSEVALKLSEIRDEQSPQSIVGISGTGKNTRSELLKRLLTAIGSPNFLTMPSMWDSYKAVASLMHGTDGSVAFDFENSDFILSLGSGLIEGWGSPVRMFQANSLWRSNGNKVVQVEPRLSATAGKADQWVTINPGTEAALVLGLCHVIIKEGFADDSWGGATSATGYKAWKDKLGRQRIGFEDLVMSTYDPTAVEAITGVKKETIVELANAFAQAKRPIAVCGRGQGRAPISMNEIMAVQSLNGLLGRINQPGGVWIQEADSLINWPSVVADELSAKGLAQARIDGFGNSDPPFKGSRLHKIPEAIASKSPYAVKAILVANANPLHNLGDSGAFKDAMQAVPFKVSFSAYMDETAQQSDYILPDHNGLEAYCDVWPALGTTDRFLGLSRPVIEPQHNTKNLGDTLIQLAHSFGGPIGNAFPWKNYQDCLQKTFGSLWDTLIENGYVDLGKTDLNDDFVFSAPDIAADASNQQAGLPHYHETVLDGDLQSYPLVLIPYDSMRIANGPIGASPFMVKTVPNTVILGNDGFVEINPGTAKTLGLKEGQKAQLATPHGRVEVRVHLFEGIHPNVVAMARGLGHTAFDDFISGKGVNINTLMSPVEDPATGMDIAWGARAKLSKV